MSFNGSGTFVINSAGQPVVANTVISATVFNALTSDLATGLSTCITKDGQTTVTANIPFGSNKITGLGSGTAATDAANLGQVQSTAAKLITVTGTDTITGTMSPALTAYAAGQLFYFIANGANTGAMTINVDGLGAKAITRDGATALIAGDVQSGEIIVICYDGTRFQMINAANSFGNTTINGTLTVTGDTALQANVSITSTLSVGGTFAVTGAATLGSTLAVTGKSDLPTVSTASMNAAVAVITTGTVTNLTSTSASIASANAAVALITTGTVTNLTSTSASIASANIAVALVTTGTVTNLTATGASIASANLGNAVITSMTLTGASVASVNAGVAVVTDLRVVGASITSANIATAVLTNNPTLNGGTANGVLYLNASKAATSGSALVFDGSNLGIGGSPGYRLDVTGGTSSFAPSNSVGAIRAQNNSTTALELHVRPASGKNGFISFTEDTVADRWVMGILGGNAGLLWGTGNPSSYTEQMRLTSTGLGIGTSSPGYKLDVRGVTASGNGTITTGFSYDTGGLVGTFSNHALGILTNGTVVAKFDTSGNLGLGVTPSAWVTYKAFQTTGSASFSASPAGAGTAFLTHNGYYDGSNWKYLDTTLASQYRQTLGVHSWWNAASGTAGNAITFTQAMTLDASSNLTLRGTYIKQVVTTGSSGSPAEETGFQYQYDATSNRAGIKFLNSYANNGAAWMSFWTSDTSNSYAERARITSGGALVVNDTDPGTARLKVVQSGDNQTAWFTNGTLGSTYPVLFVENYQTASSTKYLITGDNNGGTSIRIATNGNITNTNGSYGTISDAKMKTDIVDAGSQWADLKAVRFRKFKMKDDPAGLVQLGVVAQELEQTSPGLVDEHPDIETVEVTDEEGNVTKERKPTGTTTKSVKTSVLLMKAAVALQEAMARIEKLEAEVAALKGA